jgi:hydroxymethylglutaryl-CoA reductase
MGLHARNIAIAAGALGDQITRIAGAMIDAGTISEAAARALLQATPPR